VFFSRNGNLQKLLVVTFVVANLFVFGTDSVEFSVVFVFVFVAFVVFVVIVTGLAGVTSFVVVVVVGVALVVLVVVVVDVVVVDSTMAHRR